MRFFTTLFRSFYDLTLYHEVRSSWSGWALGITSLFFTLLAATGITIGMVMLHQALLADQPDGKPGVMAEALGQIAEQWPDLQLANNQLSSDAPMPQVITIDVTLFGERIQEDFLTIDTSGATTYENMKTPMLLTSSELIVEQRGEHRIRPLAEVFAETEQPKLLDRAYMQGVAEKMVNAAETDGWKIALFSGVMVWLFLVPALIFARYLLVIPVAALGLIAAQIMRRSLSYEAAIRVIAVALLPVTLLDAATLFIFGSGVSTIIKILVALGVLILLLLREPKRSAHVTG